MTDDNKEVIRNWLKQQIDLLNLSGQTTPVIPKIFIKSIFVKPTEVTGRLWTIMFPFSKSGDVGDPINMPVVKAEGFAETCFGLTKDRSGVFLKATAGGAHSPNSKYPRCELREMLDDNGDRNASWSSTTGRHALEATLSVCHNLVRRKQVSLVQIHDSSDDVLQIALDDNRLVVFYNDKKDSALLDPNYLQGALVSIKINIADGYSNVFYNGVEKASIKKSGSGWYFKVGCYLQSSVKDWHESPNAWGIVELYHLKVFHE